ncbi:transcriptional repressor [Ginsengibacter hankyongi]|uniref:Transcriptional repressor n=1 Tax=Ginsengibacter hankyongi TaxID=2607284 RepID=A0A5J5IKT2_9BACT|nr:Fur family transcriptional regulator [Ginsengibacter hankyongi]KAA9041666.1 transcriptional repressor [Ginsengibacter hankyongi]
MTDEVKNILKQNRLSVTDSRLNILELFLKHTSALSHADIEKNSAEPFDRVTVYRTLQTFVEKGIIHLIPTKDNSIKYALCKNDCAPGHHHDNHVHFICDECHKTICLDEVNVPVIKLPKGFKPQHSEMVVTGVCGECK